jgi:hypothetical protein
VPLRSHINGWKPNNHDNNRDHERQPVEQTGIRRCQNPLCSRQGCESAKLILSLPQHFDVFIVGHAAPENDRTAVVAWLKKNFPNTRVLALNPPKLHVLPGADYSVKLNGPETWLPVVSSALSSL